MVSSEEWTEQLHEIIYKIAVTELQARGHRTNNAIADGIARETVREILIRFTRNHKYDRPWDDDNSC